MRSTAAARNCEWQLKGNHDEPIVPDDTQEVRCRIEKSVLESLYGSPPLPSPESPAERFLPFGQLFCSACAFAVLICSDNVACDEWRGGLELAITAALLFFIFDHFLRSLSLKFQLNLLLSNLVDLQLAIVDNKFFRSRWPTVRFLTMIFFASDDPERRMPQPRSQLYNFVFRRNATFLSAMIVGAFVLEYTGGGLVDRLWNGWNSGVCLL